MTELVRRNHWIKLCFFAIMGRKLTNAMLQVRHLLIEFKQKCRSLLRHFLDMNGKYFTERHGKWHNKVFVAFTGLNTNLVLLEITVLQLNLNRITNPNTDVEHHAKNQRVLCAFLLPECFMQPFQVINVWNTR